MRLLLVAALAALPTAAFAQSAFPQGVAGGDVLADRAIVWTRTTAPGDVRVQIARDPAFSEIVADGTRAAAPDDNFTIKYDATGLSPATRYYYRFQRVDSTETSPVGTLLTAPPADEPRPFRFVHTGDSNAAHRPFRILDFAADEQPDFWIYAGDTIYSDGSADGLPPAESLEDYRAKYLQNRADAALQRLFAAAPAWTQWDDHEVVNDYDGGDPGPDLTPARIAAAYRAFFEHIPIRPADAEPLRTYRSFRYGALAEFFLLDCRQYRSADAGRDASPLDPYGLFFPKRDQTAIDKLRDPSRTMLGPAQLAWLKGGLRNSTARWKFILSSVTFTSLLLLPYDRWDGYDAERYDLLRFIDDNRIDGVVILSADIHGNSVNPDVTHFLRRSLGQSFPRNVAIPEFVSGPIATETLLQEASGVTLSALDSPFLVGLLADALKAQIVRRNGLTFLDANHYAYLVVDVTPDTLTLTHKGIPPDPTDTASPLETLNVATWPAPPTGCGLFPLTTPIAALLAFATTRRRRR